MLNTPQSSQPHVPPAAPCAVLPHGRADGRWRCFAAPRAVVQAHCLDEVLPALAQVEAATVAGATAVGMVCYEAGPAFDPALRVRAGCALPLLWFGLFDGGEVWDALPDAPASPAPAWKATTVRGDYNRAIARVRAAIAAGETYQANYTIRLHAAFDGDPWALFVALQRAQRGAYGAYLDLGEHIICSASPELFFQQEGDRLYCRPMKGTAPRGVTTAEDDAQAAALAACAKNRAENLMIVDMMRNDLGRIARSGSVAVPQLFAVERYPTVWQMTSTVTAASDASLSSIFSALFPCSSITGAPKVQTTRLLADLETSPRGMYTGAIGVVEPQRRATFSVAIRTVHVDRAAQAATYGVGGGVVWDSTADGEYAECLTKARVLTAARPDFQLLETLAWRPSDANASGALRAHPSPPPQGEGITDVLLRGYALLPYHLRRLADSSRYFGFRCDPAAVAAALAAAADGFSGPRRVRLLLAEDGEMTLEDTPLPAPTTQPWRVALAGMPVDVQSPFLYHKTTHRQVYDLARASRPGVDDVLLWNREGEVTESTIANVVVHVDGAWLTPPVRCGLLAGTLRAHLLETGALREGVIRVDDLTQVEAIGLLNGVRGWVPAVLAMPCLVSPS